MGNEFASLTLLFPATLCAKTEKRFSKHSVSIITIDGVESNVRNTSEQSVATVALKLFHSSSLIHLKIGDFVSVGLPSKNPAKYLLDGSKPSSVCLQSVQVAQGHMHTLEFTFECSEEQMKLIEQSQYVGLNGSGFYIQQKSEVDNHYSFSVHAGQNSREKTLFTGATSLNTIFTLTLPYT